MGNFASMASLSSSDYGSTHAREMVLSHNKNFQLEMSNIMQSLLDDDSDLEIDNRIIPADQKGGTAATFMLNNFLERELNSESTLMEIYKFQYTLEKSLEKKFDL